MKWLVMGFAIIGLGTVIGIIGAYVEIWLQKRSGR